jgi:cytochrome bd-type quinol oxidase subunit 2
MTDKKNILLALSIISFVLLLTAIFVSFDEIEAFGMQFSIIWIPVWTLTILLPIFNFAEIILERDSISKRIVVALIFNIINMFFIIRHFGFEFFPE